MAVCTICHREMTDRVSCDADPLVIQGRLYEPIRWSRETGYPGAVGRATTPCHDCGVRVGGVHHHGCDTEECPACHGQAISCGCQDDDDDGWDLDGPIDWIYLRHPSHPPTS
jgi:hypothetical protein